MTTVVQFVAHYGTFNGGETAALDDALATTLIAQGIATATGITAQAAAAIPVFSGIGGFTPRVSGTLARPADATTYGIGDLIGNSLTAAQVVPITFPVARLAGGSGRVSGCRCVVAAASGTIVLPAFDLLLFRPEAGIPFAAGGYPADNAPLNIPGPALNELVAVLSLNATNWRNQAGGTSAAGLVAYQAVGLGSGRPYGPFNLGSCGGVSLLGLMQSQLAWAPGAVVNTFTFYLDVDQD